MMIFMGVIMMVGIYYKKTIPDRVLQGNDAFMLILRGRHDDIFRTIGRENREGRIGSFSIAVPHYYYY